MTIPRALLVIVFAIWRPDLLATFLCAYAAYYLAGRLVDRMSR